MRDVLRHISVIDLEAGPSVVFSPFASLWCHLLVVGGGLHKVNIMHTAICVQSVKSYFSFLMVFISSHRNPQILCSLICQLFPVRPWALHLACPPEGEHICALVFSCSALIITLLASNLSEFISGYGVRQSGTIFPH